MQLELAAHQRLLLRAIVEPASVVAYSNADWELLLRLARKSELLGFLAIELEEAELITRIPVRAARQLRSRLAEIRSLQQQVRWELNRINWALGNAQIPIVALKGAAYLFAGLPFSRGRYFGDLDVLVPKERMDEFEAMLLAKGWQHPQISAYDEHYYRAWSHEIPALIHGDRTTELDAHHTIAPVTSRVRIDAQLLFDSAISSDQAGCKILCPVDMALHCAVNLFQNNELADDLRDLLDLHAMLCHFSAADSNFWMKLIARANQLRLGVALFYGLQFAGRVFQTPVPANLEADLNQKPGKLSQWIMHLLVPSALFPLHPEAPSRFAQLARLALYLRSHWIRMPPHLLLLHVGYKCYAALFGSAGFAALEVGNSKKGIKESDVNIALFGKMVRRALGFSEPVASGQVVAESIDWKRLHRLIEAHGLQSLLGARISSLNDFGLPPIFSAALGQYAMGNSLRNRMLLQEYRELSVLFQQAGIEAVALKGIASIQRIADYASIRELADIDILIDARQIKATRRLLEQRGYQTVYAPDTTPIGAEELTPEQARVYASVYHEFSFVSADGLVYVDVHWQLSPSVYPTGISAGLPLDELAYGGVLLPPYDLVYLCMHAAKDGWSELKWAIDIAYLMQDFTALQWQATWELAQRFRLRRVLLTGLMLAEWLTGQHAPALNDYADQRYRPSPRAMARLRNRLMRTPERKHRLVSCLGLNKTYIAFCDSNFDKLVYVFRMFTYPQPRDFVRLGLTPMLLPVWGLLRPFALTGHCLRRALRVLISGRNG